MEDLTSRQKQLLRFIQERIRVNGFPPTQAEIAANFGFRSATAARNHLLALARKGAIEHTDSASRGIRVRQADPAAAGYQAELPLVGRVAAGSPIMSEENIESQVRVDPALFKPRADYLLKVRGMSMRDAAILDGDYIAVHKTQAARAGQIVVARLHDEVTVKRFQQRGHRVELIAENPDFAPIVLDLRRDALAIEGICVGVIRAGHA
jgi:repressor LexA